jgi:hypothetical protein
MGLIELSGDDLFTSSPIFYISVWRKCLNCAMKFKSKNECVMMLSKKKGMGS